MFLNLGLKPLSVSALSLEACGSKTKSICKQSAEVKFILQNFCV